MPEYFKVRKLGEGTYATIYLAKECRKKTDPFVSNGFTRTDPGGDYTKMVAIKRIKRTPHGCGIEVNAIREIKILKCFKNDYLLRMHGAFEYQGEIHLVLEYVDYNMEEVIRCKNIVIMPSDIKSWMYMLLCGLKEMHDEFVMHRDIKPNNLLITKRGDLKIADFGLSRKITEKMTPNAVTRWYRAPEMLLGQTQYTMAGDMWSVGCIMAEMLLRVPLFAAETDIQQLDTICRVLGTPVDYSYFTKQTEMIKIKYYPQTSLRGIFTAVSDDALDLLRDLLQFDPGRRISVDDALNHRYFRTRPRATSPEFLPLPVSE
ncbi:KIN28 [Enterospora canceri]|uniref:[RNA-polymerase]-subunit kinase n=1 Tax=Enterospora canceri TaxID=1081671 RepID=A0A1Y1S6N2_9MICR|nr:KIN28 [Enterospora canceri]